MPRLADKDYLKINGRLAKKLKADANIIGTVRAAYFSGTKLPALAEKLEKRMANMEKAGVDQIPKFKQYKAIMDFITFLTREEIVLLFTPNEEVLAWT